MHQITLNTPSGNTDISVGRRLSEDLHKLKSKPIILIDENVLCEHNDTFCPVKMFVMMLWMLI